MKNIFKHPNKSLAAKLIIAIGLLMILGSFVFWYATLQKQEKDVLSIAKKYGDSFLDFVKKSTRNSMLTFQRPAIQNTLEDISIAEGVERVQIFNHEGKVIYSSKNENVGNFVSKDSIACKQGIKTHRAY
jgi:histidine kinase